MVEDARIGLVISLSTSAEVEPDKSTAGARPTIIPRHDLNFKLLGQSLIVTRAVFLTDMNDCLFHKCK